MGASKVLVVDDDPDVRDVVVEFIAGLGLDARGARDGDEALAIFRAERPTLVITDLKMSGMDGLELAQIIKEASPRTEILILTAHADLDSAVQAVRQGAFDYVQKPFDAETLGRRVMQALERHRLVVQAETLLTDLERRVQVRTKALEESQRRLHALFNGVADPLLIIDETLTIVAANEGAAGHSGIPAEDLAGRPCFQALWARGTPCEECLVVTTIATDRAAFATRIEDLTGRGGRRHFDCRSYPMQTPAGARKEAVEHIRDVTEQKLGDEERKTLEAQHKVDEAIQVIGGLAAGTAHDFGGLLTIIRGYAQFLMEATPGDDPRHADAEHIYSIADRGRKLVRELTVLGSAGQGEVDPVDLASLIDEMVPAIRSLLGDCITLNVRAGAGLSLVRADPVHVERLLMNLVLNARDAMTAGRQQVSGGILTVGIRNVEVGETSPATIIEGVAPGRYVELVVRDTGCGMTPEVQRRAFEPFFTTKPGGTGTGFGLATVAWIVKWCQGRVLCESQPGQGTTFRVYLPRGEKEWAEQEQWRGSARRLPP